MLQLVEQKVFSPFFIDSLSGKLSPQIVHLAISEELEGIAAVGFLEILEMT